MVKNMAKRTVPGLPVTPPDLSIEDVDTQAKIAKIDGCLVVR